MTSYCLMEKQAPPIFAWNQLPYGKPPHLWKITFFMGKRTISMATFNSYVTNYQRVGIHFNAWWLIPVGKWIKTHSRGRLSRVSPLTKWNNSCVTVITRGYHPLHIPLNHHFPMVFLSVFLWFPSCSLLGVLKASRQLLCGRWTMF